MQEFTFSGCGHNIPFLAKGSGEHTLLFVHGFPMNKSLWVSQMEVLSKKYRCLAPDLTGFGNSDMPMGYEASIDLYADELAQLLEKEAHDGAVVIGLSMGGMIALSLTERHPSLVYGLALLHTSADADNEMTKTARDQAIASILENGRDQFARSFTTLIMGKNTSAQARARSLTMMENTSYEALVSGLIALRDRPSRKNFLKSIMIPTLVLAGADDTRSTPHDMQNMAALIPSGTFDVLTGVGHMSAIEDGLGLSARLDQWLSGLPEARPQ